MADQISLSAFIQLLQTNAEELEAYNANPAAVTERLGLDASAREILRTKDEARFRQRIREETGGDDGSISMIWGIWGL